MGRHRNRSFQPGHHRSANPSHGGAQGDQDNANHNASGRHAQNRQGEAGAGAHNAGNPNQRGINEALIATWTRRLGIYTGVLAVATVFLVVASGISAFFIWESDQSIEGQLGEMHQQTTTTRAQVRANISADVFGFDRIAQGGMFMGWDVTPRWRNTGATDALDYKGIWGISFKPGPKTGLDVSDCPELTIPPNTQPTVIQAGHPFAELAQRFTVAQALQTQANEASAFVSGRLEYRDIFPDDPLHYLDWCSRIVVNNIDRDQVSLLTVKSISR
jgi:hypothetical protein